MQAQRARAFANRARASRRSDARAVQRRAALAFFRPYPALANKALLGDGSNHRFARHAGFALRSFMMNDSTRRPISPGAEEILGRYFPVLDSGFVALVDYMGTDACIERAARVSYGYGTRKLSKTRGLLRYLRRHLHTTPSEIDRKSTRLNSS